MSPLMIPLVIFAVVVLLVALKHFTEIHNVETEVYGHLHSLELEHQRKMRELNIELQRIREGR